MPTTIPTTLTRLATTLHRILAATALALFIGLALVMFGHDVARTAGAYAILASWPALAITNEISARVDALADRTRERTRERTTRATHEAYQPARYSRPYAA